MKRVVVLFVVGLVLFGVCSAQSANAQNVERNIIGTWVENSSGGTTWVFNANGNLTIDSFGSIVLKFAVTGTQLVISFDGDLGIYNISMSSDGKTLILVEYGKSRGHWLTKR